MKKLTFMQIVGIVTTLDIVAEPARYAPAQVVSCRLRTSTLNADPARAGTGGARRSPRRAVRARRATTRRSDST
jgi:hypothetical protein